MRPGRLAPFQRAGGAARIVDHSHPGHATLGSGSTGALLTHARGIQTHVSARPAQRVALPLPVLGRAELHPPLQQFREPLARKPQCLLPRKMPLAAGPAMVIAADQFQLPQQADEALAAMGDELRVAAAMRAEAASSCVPAPFFAARWRLPPGL